MKKFRGLRNLPYPFIKRYRIGAVDRYPPDTLAGIELDFGLLKNWNIF